MYKYKYKYKYNNKCLTTMKSIFNTFKRVLNRSEYSTTQAIGVGKSRDSIREYLMEYDIVLSMQ